MCLTIFPWACILGLVPADLRLSGAHKKMKWNMFKKIIIYWKKMLYMLYDISLMPYVDSIQVSEWLLSSSGADSLYHHPHHHRHHMPLTWYVEFVNELRRVFLAIWVRSYMATRTSWQEMVKIRDETGIQQVNTLTHYKLALSLNKVLFHYWSIMNRLKCLLQWTLIFMGVYADTVFSHMVMSRHTTIPYTTAVCP